MPELPEVETVCRGLQQAIVGDVIAEVTVLRAALRVPVPRHLARALMGRTIRAVRRRAKYIIVEMGKGPSLLMHLGMSGRVLVHDAPPHREKHDHIVVALASGKTLVFNDPRRFGLVTLVERAELQRHPLLAHLGPEPLEKAFSPAYLRQALQGKKAPIKTALMDQRLVVGVGNIYASEALFLCGIHPATAAQKVAMHAPDIVAAIRKVLRAAIASGGSTLRDYVRSSGDAGYFQHRFAVYGREGKSCRRCRAPIARTVLAGRASFFCTRCQRRS